MKPEMWMTVALACVFVAEVMLVFELRMLRKILLSMRSDISEGMLKMGLWNLFLKLLDKVKLPEDRGP